MAMTRIDIIMQAINELVPNAEYVIRENFAGLEWMDDRTAPTESAVQTKYDELVAAEPLNALREERDRRLSDTDWWACSDLTMTQAQTDYRQALRDITDNATGLDDVTWPTKP